METGTTGEVVIRDRGGPLSRGALFLLSLGTAAGAVKNVETTREVTRTGPNTATVTETTTGTVDTEQAQIAADGMNRAFSEESVPLEAELRIASQKFGGDTSGWMYKVGYGAAYPAGGAIFRISGGVGLGRYTFYDRDRLESTALDSSQIEGDYEYKYFGTPVRVSLRRGLVKGYFQADFNWIYPWDYFAYDSPRPSPWRTGIELLVGPAYARLELASSRMRTDNSSIGLEVGLGF